MQTTSTARTGVRGATLADRLPVAKLSSDGGTRHVRGSRAAPETARPSVGGVPAVIRRPGGGRVIGARSYGRLVDQRRHRARDLVGGRSADASAAYPRRWDRTYGHDPKHARAIREWRERRSTVPGRE